MLLLLLSIVTLFFTITIIKSIIDDKRESKEKKLKDSKETSMELDRKIKKAEPEEDKPAKKTITFKIDEEKIKKIQEEKNIQMKRKTNNEEKVVEEDKKEIYTITENADKIENDKSIANESVGYSSCGIVIILSSSAIYK